MRIGLAFYWLGTLGVLLSAVVFAQELSASAASPNPASAASVFILFGFVPLSGLALALSRPGFLAKDGRGLMYLAHGVALIAILWLLLWCFVWLAMMANMGDKAEMFIKHTAYLHLFGVSFAMAGYVTGWMARGLGERSARFLMTLGWAVSYMAWFNLFLQPELKWLWAPGVGGLLAVVGAFLISRELKPEVETAS